MKRRVELVPYDPGWPERFRAEAERLAGGLEGVARRIDHIGSTAVPGLVAKPTIDILVVVEELEPDAGYRGPLERLGYLFRPDDEPEHRFFYAPPEGPRRYQVHVVRRGGPWDERHLRFRDYLRSHQEVATEYAKLKRALAVRYEDDPLAYAEAKTPFVRDVERRAAAEPGRAANRGRYP